MKIIQTKSFNSPLGKNKKGYRIWNSRKGWVVEFWSKTPGEITGERYHIKFTHAFPPTFDLNGVWSTITSSNIRGLVCNHAILAQSAKLLGIRIKKGMPYVSKHSHNNVT